jgi:hypothetical protein
MVPFGNLEPGLGQAPSAHELVATGRRLYYNTGRFFESLELHLLMVQHTSGSTTDSGGVDTEHADDEI